jgi:hypothetical protein
MDRWEYMTYDVKKLKKMVDGLNELGTEGWEAVAMVSTWGVGAGMVHPMVLLKRRVSEGSRAA